MNYNKLISERLKRIPPSGIRRFFDIAAEMKNVITLGIGEPDFVTPKPVCDAALAAIQAEETHYTSNHGIPELRELILEYLEARFGLNGYKTEQAFVTVGVSEGIDLAIRAITEPGDEIIMPEPTYVSYMPSVLLQGGVPVTIKTTADNDFKLTRAMVEDAITDRTKAIILPFPNNPTGAIMTREDLAELVPALNKRDIFVLSDEIYAELTYGSKHCSIAEFPGMRERTVILSGFSKAFAMTGWRLGFAVGPQEIIDAMVKIHQFTMLCAPTLSQIAGIEAIKDALKTDFADVNSMMAQYARRRVFLLDAFREMGLSCFDSRGAFYLFPSIKHTGLTSEEFCEKLLIEKQVAAVPGTAFGKSGEGFIRCCYATSMENLEEAADRMSDFMRRF